MLDTANNRSEKIVAAIQMVSSNDLDKNLRDSERLIAEAAKSAANLVVLPENFACFGNRQIYDHAVLEEENGRLRSFLSAQAKKHGLWLAGGTLPRLLVNAAPNSSSVKNTKQPCEDLHRAFASVHTYAPDGSEQSRYDKIHLFDAGVEDGVGRYAESDTFAPGKAPGLCQTGLGRMGVAVCYDLRFPALSTYFQKQKIDLLAVPSAFTAKTGAAHWHALLRARAIENQCLVIAANQGGDHGHNRITYGHSCIIDAWGEVIAELAQGEGIVCALWNQQQQHDIRKKMPVLDHRIDLLI